MFQLKAEGSITQKGTGELIEFTFLGTAGFTFFVCWALGAFFLDRTPPSWAFTPQEAFFLHAGFFMAMSVTGALVFLLRFVLTLRRGLTLLLAASFASFLLGAGLDLAASLFHGTLQFAVASNFFSGLGTAFCFFLWEEHFSLFQTQKKVVLSISLACAIAGLCYILLLGLKDPYDTLIFHAMPFASLAIYLFARHKPVQTSVPCWGSHNPERGRRHFVSELALSAVSFLGLGFTSWFFLMDSTASLFSVLGIFLASLIFSGVLNIVLLALVPKSVLYLFSGLLGPVSAVCLIILSWGFRPAVLIALFVFWATYICCIFGHIANIAMDSSDFLKLRIGQPGLFLCSDMLMLLIGLALGLPSSFAEPYQVDPFRGLVVLAIILLLRLFCERIMPESARRVYFGSRVEAARERRGPSAQPDESGPVQPRALAPASNLEVFRETSKLNKAIEQCRRSFDLSARETEVFSYLVRGYNARSISEKLFVSVATIKTHTHNIYQKSGIHSQQGLIAHVDDAAHNAE